MQKKRKDNQFIKHAYYNGGNTAFRKFVFEHLKYPEEALKKDIEGVVHLKIDIDYKGKVTGAKVMKGIGHGCDKEAIRIIKTASYEVPSNAKNVRVIFHKNVRIQFKKPKPEVASISKPKKETKVSSPLNLEYEVTTKTQKLNPKLKVSGKPSYNYTINL